jgi:hypothetical protein
MAMTLSGTEWGLQAPFPLPRPRPARSRGRTTLGVGPSPAGGPKRPTKRLLGSIAEWWAARRARGSVPVRCYSIGTLALFSARAAVPAVEVEERSDAVVLSLDAPGANTNNTEVVWDAEGRRLAVGVWVGPRPSAGRRSAFPPELGWYRAKRLPYCDGTRAVATVRDGVVEVVIPWFDPDRTSNTSLAPSNQGMDDETEYRVAGRSADRRRARGLDHASG